MTTENKLNRALIGVAALAIAGALLAGCGGPGGNITVAAGGSAAGTTGGSSMPGMPGMKTGSNKAISVNGIKPVPTQTLAQASWQGMKIIARSMTAAPFEVFNGTKEQTVKPGPKTSFHLMVMLNDAHTNVPIPYASVWATIRKQGKVIYDERQWPMLSAFMGPHYGNNVSLPGAGSYQLSLLISPPVAARHMEYAKVWQKPHRVNVTFHWKPVS